jgi:hypothetical protein
MVLSLLKKIRFPKPRVFIKGKIIFDTLAVLNVEIAVMWEVTLYILLDK